MLISSIGAQFSQVQLKFGWQQLNIEVEMCWIYLFEVYYPSFSLPSSSISAQFSKVQLKFGWQELNIEA